MVDLWRLLKKRQPIAYCIESRTKIQGDFIKNIRNFYLKGNETIAYAIFACYNNVNPYKGGYENVKSDLMGLPYAFFFFC